MPSSTQEIGSVRGRSHYREVHCQALLHQLPAQVWRPQGIHTSGENAFPACDKGGWQDRGRRRNPLENVLPAGEAGLVFNKLSCYIRIQGLPSSALDRPDQDTTQIPERPWAVLAS